MINIDIENLLAPCTDVNEAILGDRAAQTRLWRRHRRWLAAILLTYKPREVEIEDLMQDVAIKFVTKLHTLRDIEAFKPWLRRIAINAARESARGLKGVRGRLSLEDREFTGEPGILPTAQTEEAHGLLRHALTLPEEFREPLILRCVQGLGCRQIAELLGLPVTTIETRLSRARKMLRQEWLAMHDDNPADPGGIWNTDDVL